MLSTVVRAGAVLNLFDVRSPDWGVSEIARRLDISKSQSHEMVSALCEIGLLKRTSTGRYRLGWRSFKLGAIAAQTEPLTRHASKHMRRATEERPETSLVLAIWDAEQPVHIGRSAGRAAAPGVVGDSQTLTAIPIHAMSTGKVLASMIDPQGVDAHLANHDWKRFTARTITDGATFSAELVAIRQRGFAYDVEEFTSGVACIAAPIQRSGGETVAAIGLSTDIDSWNANRHYYVPRLLSIASAVSRAVGSIAEDRRFSSSIPHY